MTELTVIPHSPLLLLLSVGTAISSPDATGPGDSGGPFADLLERVVPGGSDAPTSPGSSAPADTDTQSERVEQVSDAVSGAAFPASFGAPATLPHTGSALPAPGKALPSAPADPLPSGSAGPMAGMTAEPALSARVSRFSARDLPENPPPQSRSAKALALSESFASRPSAGESPELSNRGRMALVPAGIARPLHPPTDALVALPDAIRRAAAALMGGGVPPCDEPAGPGLVPQMTGGAVAAAHEPAAALERLARLRSAGRGEGVAALVGERKHALGAQPLPADNGPAPTAGSPLPASGDAASVLLRPATTQISASVSTASATPDHAMAVDRAVETLRAAGEGQPARIAIDHARFGTLELRLFRTEAAGLEMEIKAPPAELRHALADSVSQRERIDASGVAAQSGGGSGEPRANTYERGRQNEPRSADDGRANRGRDGREQAGHREPGDQRRGARDRGSDRAA